MNNIHKLIKEEKERILKVIHDMSPGSEQYSKAMDNLKVLSETYKPKVSLDTIITAATSLLSIGCILKYEQIKCITSKALSFIIRKR